jgi:choline dehydrogenase-like flavoprotein
VTQTADVLVVGGGAAGAALAWRLSERDVDVLVLEQGD